jgi:hypothetical protein
MNSLSAAIYTKLQAGTALTALLAGGSVAIYEDHAKGTAALPYVIFNHQSGVWDMMMGSSRFADVIYQVKAVSGSAWPKEADTIDTQIDALLHNASLTVTGYGVLSCARESDVRYSETEGDQVFQHVGALYRIELQKT